MNDLYEERIVAIRQWLSGKKSVSIYSSLRRSSVWFYKWLKRYKAYGLEGLKDLPKARKKQSNQTGKVIEDTIVNIRRLREKRDREETKYALIGADAIWKELKDLGYDPPSSRTVHRIMVRNDLIVDSPKEKPVQAVIDRHYPCLEIKKPGQLHQLDLVGPRYLKDDSQKYYFCTLKDVCSLRIGIKPANNHQALTIVQFLMEKWKTMGIPSILQHDNGLEFRGSNRYPRTAGLVTKFCLALGVESLFIPARQPQRNGAIENFNGLFQRLLFRNEIASFEHLKQETKKLENVANSSHPHIPLDRMTSLEYERAVKFIPILLEKGFKFNKNYKFTEIPNGKISFICRIRKSGRITIASEKFDIDSKLAYDYVYATIFIKEQKLKIFHNKKLIKEFGYELKL